jgi:2-dehydropantoate 2-reductase
MLARAGVPVTLIGRAEHMEAIAREGLRLQHLRFEERVRPATTTDISTVGSAKLVLFCVKTLDTETAAAAIQPHLSADSTVISLQNGVDNVARIHSATGLQAIPAVVYVAASIAAAGYVKHSGRGDLILGNPWHSQADALHGTGGHRSVRSLELSLPPEAAKAAGAADLEAIAEMFRRAEVPCKVSSTIQADLWTKMVMNCAYNALSALGKARYGRLVRSEPVRDLMRQIVAEAVAIARADGVDLPEAKLVQDAFELGEAMSGATSSTAQDIARAKATEIDSLNGYLVRRGAELGIPTPVNQTLHTLVKVLETRDQ